MKKILFKGCGTAIVTPFTEDGIDYEAFERLIEFQIQEKADAIIVCGTTGESSTMSLQERMDCIKFVVDTVHKRIPVIAGTGSNNTKTAIGLSKYAESIGVDGVLVVTPYYNKTTQEGLVKHYEAIASSISIPIILYNVPSRTGLNITPETAYRLSQIENIVAIKEASGNISQVAKIAQLCRENLQIYSGNDDQIIPVLSLGGIGVISVLANVYPKEVHDLVTQYLNQEATSALKIQLDALPLIEALFCEVNPIPVKAALNLLGYSVGNPRLPLVEMEEQKQKVLKKELQNFEQKRDEKKE